MKGVSFGGVRGRQFFLTLVTFICTTILIWAWSKTPIITTILRQQGLSGVHHSEATSGISFADYNPSDAALTQETGTTQGDAMPPSHVDAVENADIGTGVQHKNDCNYAKGKWVHDEHRPLYSGFECKQWLSEMWACRMTDRLDFSFESFKWKPDGCKMPDFSGSSFLERTKDKTVAFVGDSLGRQQFQSLMCMATGGKMNLEVKDVGIEYGLVKAPGAIRPDGWVYRFPDTNTTILYYWSASLCDLIPLNNTKNVAMHLDRPARFLQQYIHRFDVLVLNTGHHWNRGKLVANRWEMYVDGAPINDSDLLIDNAKNLTIYSVARWVDSQLPKYPRLKAFFRTISPRHFVNGDWNSGGSCNSTIPLSHGSQVSQEGSKDSIVEGALKGTRVKILDITALSQLRDEGHISMYTLKGISKMQDCLHWCLPGIPDAWNEILFAQL